MHNRYYLLIFVIMVLILALGCSNQDNPEVTDTSSVPAAEATDSSEPSIAGVGNADSPIQNPLNDNTEPTDATQVTDSTESFEDTTDPTEATQPTEVIDPTEDSTEPEETTPSTPTESTVTSYEAYNAMTPDEQMAFFNTFDSMEAFVAWYNTAKAEYEALHPDIDIGDGNINIGDLTGGGK